MVISKERFVFLTLLAIAVGLRFAGLSRDPWIDEVSSITVAFSSDPFASLRHYDHPPLYFVLLRAWSSIGDSIEWLRGLSALVSVMTMAAIFLWLRSFSKRAAYLGTLIFGFMPAALTFGQEIRNYPLLMLGFALSLLCAEAIRKDPHPRLRWIAFLLVLSLCSTTHVLGILVTISCVLYLWAREDSLSRIIHGWRGVSLLVPFVVWMTLISLFLTDLQKSGGSWYMPPPSPRLIASVCFEILGVPSLLWPLTTAKSAGPFVLLAVGIVTFAIFTFLVHNLLRGSFKAASPAIIAVLGYAVPVLIYSMCVTPIFISRTILPCVVPLCGFLALLIDSIKPERARSLVIAIVTMFAFISGSGYLRREAYKPREPWRDVATLLSTSSRPILVSPRWAMGTVTYYMNGLSHQIFSLEEISEERLHSLLAGEGISLITYTQPGTEAALTPSPLSNTEQKVLFQHGPIQVKNVRKN